jgi:GNAT superfamily N-acetyltransferase
MTGRYVLRLIRRSEIPEVVRVQHAAFNDPTNTTPDEISQILASEAQDETGEPATPEERKAKRVQSEYELYDKRIYSYVGAYLVPDSVPEADEEDSSSLPAGSVLAGFGVWRRLDPSSPPEAPEWNDKEQKDPNLLNRFMAQMWRRREDTMQGKTYWFLKLLCIDPQHQRKGLGTMLLAWGVKRADKQGVDAWLESSPMGKGAYLKAGFRILGIDQIDEPRAKRGFVDWPYMIHDKPSH